jgi:hypothetical protein
LKSSSAALWRARLLMAFIVGESRAHDDVR